MHNLADTYNGMLPPVYIEYWVNPALGHPYAGPFAPRITGTGFFILLPFIEQEALYNQSVHPAPNVGYYAYHNNVHTTMLKVFLAPLDPTAGDRIDGWGVTSYAMNYQVFGRPAHPRGWPWGCTGLTKLPTIPDGLSNTVLFAEKRGGCQKNGDGYWVTGTKWAGGWWNANWMPMYANTDIYGASAWLVPQPRPTDASCEPHRATAFSAGGCQVGLADGSVRNVTASISQSTWMQAQTPNGGEVAGNDW
jgi:hypothetical protein